MLRGTCLDLIEHWPEFLIGNKADDRGLCAIHISRRHECNRQRFDTGACQIRKGKSSASLILTLRQDRWIALGFRRAEVWIFADSPWRPRSTRPGVSGVAPRLSGFPVLHSPAFAGRRRSFSAPSRLYTFALKLPSCRDQNSIVRDQNLWLKFRQSTGHERTHRAVMSNAKSLSILTPLLNSIGQQRLYEFLDAVDTPTAARFRMWLGTASESDVKAAAESLNRSPHGREFVGWWQARDTSPDGAEAAQGMSQRRYRTPLEHLHTQARARAANNDITMGAILLFVGLMITGLSYSLAASGANGGSYIIAVGAIVWGAIRLFRGLMS
jgi:hypothetical protein